VVAWGVMSLLPAEGMIALDSRHGYALIYALLLAAIAWNLASDSSPTSSRETRCRLPEGCG